MATRFRYIVAKKVLSSLVKWGINPDSTNTIDLSRIIRINTRIKHEPQLILSYQELFRQINQEETSESYDALFNEVTKRVQDSSGIITSTSRVLTQPVGMSFGINIAHFMKEVLSSYTKIEELTQTNCVLNAIPRAKVLVEYSSPNIAKVFHVGHLRSTILGNFISNLHSYLGHQVIQINYLGDWGTQYGLLSAGFEKFGSEESLTKDPIGHLQEVYVLANKLAETDNDFRNKARIQFQKLENGDHKTLAQWEKFRSLSIEEYKRMYERLGIRFDFFHGESMYSSEAQKAIHQLQEKGLATFTEDGAIVCKVDAFGGQERSVTLSKSDGSTLYISRDIAAAIDRKKRYDFDKAFYVVDNGQSDHFIVLKDILHKMGYTWSNTLHHIKFGRIKGMSTRKGQVVTLESLLNEARDLAVEKMKLSPNTKVKEDGSEVADILGITSVFVNDMRSRRCNEYTFNWDQVLQKKGDSGFTLQYSHARIVGLEKNCGVQLNFDCDTSCLVEPEAVHLAIILSRFDEVLYQTYNDLEPCILVQYLFQLSHAIGKAMKVLTVKNQETSLAQARLLLFHTSRKVFHEGMKILGLRPLNEM